MAITEFIQQIWSAKLLQSFAEQAKFSSPAVCNRDYEGDATGDSVKITSISDPTVTDYVPGTTSLTFEDLADAARILYLNQIKSIAFGIEDVSKAQSANGGALMAEAVNRGGYKMAKTADTYVQTIMESDVAAANKIGATAITSSALAVARLVAHGQMLDESDTPDDGQRYTIVPSWFHSLLALDTAFITYDALTGGEMLRKGIVGSLLGFNIIKANYALSTGDDWYVYSGHPEAITFAEQLRKLEALRPQEKFKDAVKGLFVYGAKVTRPSSICMTLCSKT